MQVYSVKSNTPVSQDNCIYATISNFYVKFLADSDFCFRIACLIPEYFVSLPRP